MEGGISEIKAEYIPDTDHVFRNIRYTSWLKPKKRVPNETDFIPDADGLSVNWDKYCSIDKCFILIGLTQNPRTGDYLPPREFKIIKFNVGELRNIVLMDDRKIDDVVHNPKEYNIAHALVVFEDDEEIRLKLCDIVEKNYDKIVFKTDFNHIDRQLEKLRNG